MTLRTRRYANERQLVLAGLGLISALAVGLELVRELHYGAHGHKYLLWNLFLAWIPLVLALVIYDRYRRGSTLLRLAPALALWLLFLPNAPYIVTDFIHLAPSERAPLWFDGLMFSTFAWTGLLLGFVSLYLVHAPARHRHGAAAAWSGAVGVLGLVSVGICLGRYLRWNSWDLVLEPGARLAQLTPHLTDPAALGRATLLTFLLTAALAVGYSAFYALVGLRLELEPARRAPRA